MRIRSEHSNDFCDDRESALTRGTKHGFAQSRELEFDLRSCMILELLRSLPARLKKWLIYRVAVTQQVESSYCSELLGTCIETFGKVDVVS